MSQHDFNIANQTFPSFRADLNDALVAAATMSAGSSAPTTPYAYQLWFDTTTSTWKVRNSGNTAWISTITTDLATGNVGIGTSSPEAKLHISTGGGVVPFASSQIVSESTGNNYIELNGGSTSTTAIYFGDSSDQDAGGVLYNHSNDSLSFRANAASRMLIDSSGVDVTGTVTTDGVTSSAAIVSQTGGSNSAPSIAITSGSLGVNGITAPSANTLGFVTGTAERMRIDSSGNVGIGGSPTENFEVFGASSNGTAKIGQLMFKNSSGNYAASTDGVHIFPFSDGNTYINNFDGGFVFRTGASVERMRIDSSGNVLVGTTTAKGNYLTVGSSSVAGSSGHFDRSGDGGLVRFYRSGSEVGYISVTSSSTAYNTSSDYRLKTAVNYDWDATSRLKQLKPARFEWISDGDDAVPVDGFLAHEVQDVVPEAISGTKDGMIDEEYTVSAATGDIYTPAVEATFDEDGVELTAAVDEVIHSADVERPEELAEGQQWRETTAAVMGTRSVPDYQGIDQSKLVPLLVKTIQELEARITALEAS